MLQLGPGCQRRAQRGAGRRGLSGESGAHAGDAGLEAGPPGWDWAEGDWAAGSWAGSGLLGWAAVGFGVCWVFFFSISIYSLFSISNSNKV